MFVVEMWEAGLARASDGLGISELWQFAQREEPPLQLLLGLLFTPNEQKVLIRN